MEQANRITGKIVLVIAVALAVFSITIGLVKYNLLGGRYLHLVMVFPIAFLSKGILEAKEAKVWRYIVYPVLAIIGVLASYYIYHEATALTRNRMGNYNS
ncbi:MAG: hypothetical protein LUE86_04545, partial [Clostridiales bacterium]|nr:hypothetical protein [Clostridiales bacterium]